MKKEIPSIELYMYSLNQEFPVGKGHSSFIKRKSEIKRDLAGTIVNLESAESQVFNLKNPQINDWRAQWISNEWIKNHTKAIGTALVERGDPFEELIIREEDFGGIVFDPSADRVYKVNSAGLELIKEIKNYQMKKGKKVGKFSSNLYSKEECNLFIAFLKGAGLWKD